METMKTMEAMGVWAPATVLGEVFSDMVNNVMETATEKLENRNEIIEKTIERYKWNISENATPGSFDI